MIINNVIIKIISQEFFLISSDKSNLNNLKQKREIQPICSWFLLFVIVMSSKAAANTELVNTELRPL